MNDGTYGTDGTCGLRVRQAVSQDYVPLAELWRRSVEATHHFLSSDEVERLLHDVRVTYLPGVEVVWVAEIASCGRDATAAQALAFYKQQGFRVVGRSALDGQGNPYPLLHMEWGGNLPEMLRRVLPGASIAGYR